MLNSSDWYEQYSNVTKGKLLIEKAIRHSLGPGYMRSNEVLLPVHERQFIIDTYRKLGYLAVFGPEHKGWATVVGTITVEETSPVKPC